VVDGVVGLLAELDAQPAWRRQMLAFLSRRRPNLVRQIAQQN
jgi:hypothetical protein